MTEHTAHDGLTPVVIARPSFIRALLSATGVIGAGVIIAVAAAGGTYAIWNDEVAAHGATVTTGDIGLTVNNLPSFTVDLSGTALLPGRTVVQAAPIQLKNTGITPLRVTSTGVAVVSESTPLMTSLRVSLRPATSATCTVTSGGTSALTAAIAPVDFTVGQTRLVCLEVGLLDTAPPSVQGASAAITINLNAAQVRP